jgi:hypothetical protein
LLRPIPTVNSVRERAAVLGPTASEPERRAVLRTESSEVINVSVPARLVAVGVIAISGVLIAPAASAAPPGSTDKDTDGAAATCLLTVTADRGDGGIHCTLRDTKADGDAPYVEWNSSNYPGWQRVYNRNGNGSSFDFDRSRFIDGGGTLEWRVCRDRGTLFTDNCSATEVRTAPPS